MELIHAYPNAKLARAQDVAYYSPGQVIPGTRITFALAAAGWGLLANAANGLNITTNRETMQIDVSDALDAARTESYWITTGWKWTSRSATGVSNKTVFVGNVALASPNEIFALAGGVVGSQVAFTEVAVNPITKEIRVYVNGNRLPGTFTYDNSGMWVRFAQNTPAAAAVYVGDMYVGRFEGNEEPRLRRWNMAALNPATNGIGAGIAATDGTMVSVQGTELVATYNIPANTLAVCVDATGESINNASDLTVRLTDGTTTSNKRQSTFSGALPAQVSGNPQDFKGHGMIGGTIKPAANATTLTVGVKALDRT